MQWQHCYHHSETGTTFRKHYLPYSVSGFHVASSDFLSSCFDCKGSNLYMGSIGDSRAILGSKDSNDSMVAVQLTVDLKPDLPSKLYHNLIVTLLGNLQFMTYLY